MLYKVPQKIDLEDKVIGPLTFRQFLYLLAGILPSFIIAKILEKYGLSIFLGAFLTAPIWLVSLLLAFGKFQEQNIDQILIAFLHFVQIPKILIWQRTEEIPHIKILAKKKRKQEFIRPRSLESRLQKIHESINIYHSLHKEKGEQRIMARPKSGLVIKTRIKPLTSLPETEKKKIPQEIAQEASPQISREK